MFDKLAGHRHWAIWALCGALALPWLAGLSGCDRRAAPRVPGTRRQGAVDPSNLFLQLISETLNGLAEEVELNLTPEEKLLDASNSDDGNEVLATCIPNPAVPDGPCNYLQLPRANADFVRLGVRPGDIVRYYVNIDEESAERGFEQRSYFSLIVRRLSQTNPKSALIVEQGLSNPVLYPERMEIWRYSDARMNEIRSALELYIGSRRPRVDWEPSPDRGALELLNERANRWFRNQKEGASEWTPDPLIDMLPDSVRKSVGELRDMTDLLAAETLRDGQFERFETRWLQQAIWCRDIAAWAKGRAVTDREIAAALFDWTIRNVQLVTAKEAPHIHQPWQALLHGRGTAEMRGWVFAELCRQQQLPAVLLGVSAAPEQRSDFWCAAAQVDNKWLLFDPRLGAAIPGETPDRPASLEEVVANAELLERLGVEEPGGERLEYPVDAQRLQSIEAWIVADPLQLSRRAQALESALEGERFVVLTASTATLADQLREHAAIGEVQLWSAPFERFADYWTAPQSERQQAALAFAPFASHPLLYKARVLHFQGYKEAPVGQKANVLATARDGHRDAIRAYQDKDVRPTNKAIAAMAESRRVIDSSAKQNAAYWLGLLLYDQGNYKVAERWLDDRTLQAAPAGPWARGARYNLARTHESLGNLEQARELLLQTSADDPQRHGNLWRASRLTAAQADNGGRLPL